MSNYKETSVAGTEWVRCGVVQIVNPYQRNPAIQFVEERVLHMGDGRDPVFTPDGAISVSFDPAKTIPLLNPETGAPTGRTATFGEAYAILYSAYMQAAAERDASVHAESTEP